MKYKAEGKTESPRSPPPHQNKACICLTSLNPSTVQLLPGRGCRQQTHKARRVARRFPQVQAQERKHHLRIAEHQNQNNLKVASCSKVKVVNGSSVLLLLLDIRQVPACTTMLEVT